MLNLSCVVRIRKLCFINRDTLWFPNEQLTTLVNWFADPITWGRSALSWPHHAFKLETKLHTGYVMTLPFSTASDTQCMFLQHPVVGATNSVGQFCYVWQAEVWRWVSLDQRIIWHSRIQSVVCHLWGIRNHIQFTHFVQAPGCFPLWKRRSICWFLQVFVFSGIGEAAETKRVP